MSLKDQYQNLIVEIVSCQESELDLPIDRLEERAIDFAVVLFETNTREDARDYVESDVQEELDKRVRECRFDDECLDTFAHDYEMGR